MGIGVANSSSPPIAPSGYSWQESDFGAGIPARFDPGMTYDAAHHQTVLFGGWVHGAGNPFGDTWVRGSGGGWTQVFPASSPSPRSRPMMAYDYTHGNVVLFGGIAGNFQELGDTWTWNGSNWTQVCSSCGPHYRWGGNVAYDGSRVILFGGNWAFGDCCFVHWLNDTWGWTGSSWTQFFPSRSPAPRDLAAMTLDGVTGLVRLFGGDAQDFSSTLGDTWTWDGTPGVQNWTQENPATSPPASSEDAMMTDTAAGIVILYDGSGGSSGKVNTWAWGNGDWVPLTTTTSPPARDRAGIDYDDDAQQIVLFGGSDPVSLQLLNDTWTFSAVNGYSNTQLQYHGGSVETTSTNYLIFWGTGFSPQYVPTLTRFFTDVGGTSFYGLMGQYYQTSGSGVQRINNTAVLGGTFVDTQTAYPNADGLPLDVSDSDIQNEARRVAAAKGWQVKVGDNFFVFTEPNRVDCQLFGSCSPTFCGYHSSDVGGNLIYATMPYPTGSCQVFTGTSGDAPSDGAVNIASHELFEMVTDPQTFNPGWCGSQGAGSFGPVSYCSNDEIGDKCENMSMSTVFLGNGHTYLVQPEWSNRAGACATS